MINSLKHDLEELSKENEELKQHKDIVHTDNTTNNDVSKGNKDEINLMKSHNEKMKSEYEFTLTKQSANKKVSIKRTFKILGTEIYIFNTYSLPNF
jgi:hypothetical protein